MDYIILMLLIAVIIRNIRKDKADGRGFFGGASFGPKHR